MVQLKTWWQGFINVAVLISFVMNFILLIVLIVLVIFIFDIKRGFVQPLVDGLHSSFVGLDESTIITTIKVNDTVPVKLNIHLQANTSVILTDNVPVRANASFNLPGGGGTINGAVSIVLPTGLKLPVSLDLMVPVDDKLPIALNVPVNIRVKDTQLHDAVDQLRSLLDPYVRLLGNLPNNWSEVWAFGGNVLSGKQPSLFSPNQQSLHPWPGFHTGLGTPTPTPYGTPSTPLATPSFLTPVFDQSGVTSVPGTGDTSFLTPPAPTSSGATDSTLITPTHTNDLGIITPVPH